MSKKHGSRDRHTPAGADWPRCPCGCQAVLRPAGEVCKRARPGMMAYVCPRYPECDSYVLARPDTLKPMGTLAWPELRRLRRAAHISFNRLYESDLMTKREAYRWLAGIVQAPMAYAHIGHLGEYYCRVVIEESEKLLARNKLMKPKSNQTEGRERYASTYRRGTKAG